ncbi:hypothetical protein HPB50_004915 [Hyalomma asiaticum]|uniref:Uncharacterized protein n=1 Tax=Hyalomma asiaticum TaxID=266040 RepID=A0ACB7S3Z4_HYAAI|nr:hypothetical protein HPB50_004915 [Hyalomma asiaticum]
MMRGQGYDGAAAMSGAFNGVQALILEDFPTALYTHCSSHSLNLCLSDASAVQDIRRAFGTMSEVLVVQVHRDAALLAKVGHAALGRVVGLVSGNQQYAPCKRQIDLADTNDLNGVLRELAFADSKTQFIHVRNHPGSLPISILTHILDLGGQS